MKTKRIALCLLVLALALAPVTALADLQRGDRGEEVRELQTLLLETGWLFEEPDGIFGRNTENALISFQNSAGLPATGRAGDDTMRALRQQWSNLHGAAYNDDPVYTPDPGANGCRLHINEDGTLTLDYCLEHTEMLAQEADLLAANTVDGARAACALWEAEIEAMYTNWLNDAEPEYLLGVTSAYGAWRSALEAQRVALEAAYPNDPIYVEKYLGMLLKAQVFMLCSFGVEYVAGH